MLSLIIPGLYIGNVRDSVDTMKQKKFNVTHILSIHENARRIQKDKEYLCIVARDSPEQKLTQFFSQCNDFIHEARLKGGNVIVHCISGVSRSVTVTIAYIMTVTDLGWKDALNAISGVRNCVNPNYGFQRQLQQFETQSLEKERARVKNKYGPSPHDDTRECRVLLANYQKCLPNGHPLKKVGAGYHFSTNSYKKKSTGDTSQPKQSERAGKLPSDSDSDSKCAKNAEKKLS